MPISLIPTNDNGALFSYYSESYNVISNSYEYKSRIVKINSFGDVIKYKNFNDTNFMVYHIFPVIEHDTNFVLLCIGDNSISGDSKAKIYRLDENFNVKDSNLINLTSTDNPHGFIKSDDNKFYISITNGVIILDSNLNLIRKSKFTLVNHAFDAMYNLIQLYDDNFASVGRLYTNNNEYQTYVVKFDANGDTIWTKKFGDTDFDAGYDILETVNNGMAICGTTQSDTGTSYLRRAFFIILNSEGEFSTSMEELSKASNIKVYPNPAKDYIQINTDLINSCELEIYNVSGKLILKKKIENTSRINIEDFFPGLYIYKLSSGKDLFTGKFIKI